MAREQAARIAHKAPTAAGDPQMNPIEASSHSLFLPTSPGGHEGSTVAQRVPISSIYITFAAIVFTFVFTRASSRHRRRSKPRSTTSRHSSLDEHPSPRSHLMDVHLETASSLYRLSGPVIGDEGRSRLASSDRVDVRVSDNVPGMAVRPLPPNADLYPYQHPLQPQDQQRGVPEHSYPPETISVRPRQVSPFSISPIPPVAETCLSHPSAPIVPIPPSRTVGAAVSNAA